ncbi:FAD:protein FMN transferase [Kordiimonas sp.]|uniref:FAD:protein FMN transferase n=1 Tax=Kordiimonas sp. TaxID=1970157 RepID=UPI003A94485D
MGAEAELSLYHEDEGTARDAIERVVAEARRLERIFSLYHPSSKLIELNANGALASPPPEMVDLLEQSRGFWKATGGTFDPTVQPLFEHYADRFSSLGSAKKQPLVQVLDRVGFENVTYTDELVSFKKPGMALTLNGIAQGYITDRVHDMLKAAGFKSALVNMGEYRALGTKSDGALWRIGIADAKKPWQLFDTLEVSGGAIATSAPSGATFDADGQHHHLLHPLLGTSPSYYRSVTVKAPSATCADALSTAFSIMPVDDIKRVALQLAGVGVLLRTQADEQIRVNV